VFVPGEWGAFLVASWEVVLFAILCVLAYLGAESVSAWVLSRVLWTALMLAGVAFNTFFSMAVLSPEMEWPLPAGAGTVLGWVLLLSLGALMTGVAVQTPPARAWLTRQFPRQEWTSVRMLALAITLSFSLLPLIPLLLLGEAPLLAMLRSEADAEAFVGGDRGASGMLRDQMYSLSWTLAAAALAVGYGIRRNGSEVLARLGLGRMSLRDARTALIATVLLLAGSYFVNQAIVLVWEFMGWRVTDEAVLEWVFAPFLSVTGAVVVAVSAGLGEEVAVRGILQPRLGILLPNVFFTALHAYQYGWDGLLSVFLVGMALGVIRQRTSTTVAATVHGGYDFVLVMLEVLGRS